MSFFYTGHAIGAKRRSALGLLSAKHLMTPGKGIFSSIVVRQMDAGNTSKWKRGQRMKIISHDIHEAIGRFQTAIQDHADFITSTARHAPRDPVELDKHLASIYRAKSDLLDKISKWGNS